jgi:hypothetical protein
MSLFYGSISEIGYYFHMATRKVTHEDRIESQQKLAAKEQRVYQMVKKILDKADLEDLLKMGAPSDEYDSESRHIAKALLREGGRKIPPTKVAYIIALVFHMQFHQWTEPVRYFGSYFDVAHQIQAKLQDIA